jgi:pimeloyl-ACP methyl ester carboxylesterase
MEPVELRFRTCVMPILRRLTSAAFCAFCAAFLTLSEPGLIESLATEPPTIVPPLWDGLTPGPYDARMKILFRYDSSRTWKITRTYDGTFSPDLNGRPIQINVWYPAKPASSDQRMTFADYVNQAAPDQFSQFNGIMRERNRDDAVGSVSRDHIPDLQKMQMFARSDVQPAPGPFPAVLYFGGLNAPINSNVVLAEYLASHGYVFASVSLLGPSNEQSFQSRNPDDFEASVRDMEFAWSTLQEEKFIDPGKVAVVGHSVGAIEAVILGLRSSNVAVVVGLDGTYGFAGLSGVLTRSWGYDPNKMRAAFVDLRRAQGAQGNEPLDLSAVESFRYADRTFITIDRMHHSDFTSFAMIGAYFRTPLPTGYPLNGWNRETGRAGYESVCRILLSVFDAKLKSSSTATAIEHEITPAMTIRHENAIPSPPSPLEAATLTSAQGLDAAKAAFLVSCGTGGIASCIDADRFNTWGYNFLGQVRAKDALAVFELNVWAHPTNANLHDSLSDGFSAVGDKEHAREAVERAIALAPSDPSFDSPTARSAFLAGEKSKLQQWK